MWLPRWLRRRLPAVRVEIPRGEKGVAIGRWWLRWYRWDQIHGIEIRADEVVLQTSRGRVYWDDRTVRWRTRAEQIARRRIGREQAAAKLGLQPGRVWRLEFTAADPTRPVRLAERLKRAVSVISRGRRVWLLASLEELALQRGGHLTRWPWSEVLGLQQDDRVWTLLVDQQRVPLGYAQIAPGTRRDRRRVMRAVRAAAKMNHAGALLPRLSEEVPDSAISLAEHDPQHAGRGLSQTEP